MPVVGPWLEPCESEETCHFSGEDTKSWHVDTTQSRAGSKGGAHFLPPSGYFQDNANFLDLPPYTQSLPNSWWIHCQLGYFLTRP